jgi:hypothetical protein
MLKKRLFGMMTLLVGVMLVLAMIGCGDNGNPTSPSGGNGNGNGSGDSNTGWPSGSTLSNFGLSELTAPTGATGITWYSEGPTNTGIYTASVLMINFSGTTSHVAALDTWFGNNEWDRDYFDEGYDGNYTKGTFNIGDGYGQPGSYDCYLSYGENSGCTIVVTKYH